MSDVTRWITDNAAGHSERYVKRFRRLAAGGADLAGEARLLDALVPPAARILDAGCGSGRVGAELHRRGHVVVGVDADPVLVAAAITDYPGPRWLVADLSSLHLPDEAPFDAAVLAGNVMVFLAPGTELVVLDALARALCPGGALVAGFALDRSYGVTALDADAARVGLAFEHRFATWDLRPFDADARFAVSVFRRPGGASSST